MTYPEGLRALTGRFPSVLLRLSLIILGLSGSACTAFRVTLHTEPAPASMQPPPAGTPTVSLVVPPTELLPATTPTPDPPATATATLRLSTPTANLHAQLDALEEQVIALRGLYPNQPIPRVFTPMDALRQTRRDAALDGSTEKTIAPRLSAFQLLGLVGADMDLSDYLELGFREVPSGAVYRAKTGQILLPESSSLSLDEKLAYIGAFTLALLDQHFPFPDGPMDSSIVPLLADDQALALGAMIDGDRTLLQDQWLRIYAPGADPGGSQSSFGARCPPGGFYATSIFPETAELACEYGLPFVRQAYLDGGWAAVDALYLEAPASTEQLIHPEKFSPQTPQEFDLKDLELPDPRWRITAQAVLGEWRLQKTLSPYLAARAARLAAEGWAGDTLAVVESGSGRTTVYLLLTTWRTIYDAAEFVDFFQEYLTSRFPTLEAGGAQIRWEREEMVMISRQSGTRTLWLLAPDRHGAELMAASLGFSELSP